MKLLVTGGGGQIATVVARNLPRGWQAQCLSHAELDIGNLASVKAATMHFSPDVIINTAALTAVDEAEKSSPLAFQVNRDAVHTLAFVCAKKSIPLIHLSTDYVFDGTQSIPYTESDTVNPINVYGLSKWEGEEVIRNLYPFHVILRLSSVFSPYGKNFVRSILALGQKRATLSVVSDQTHCPTSADSVAYVLYEIVRQLPNKIWGTYHYCDLPAITWYDFAERIIRFARCHLPIKTQRIYPVSTAEFAATARRPSYSVLSCAKIKRDLGVTQSHWLEDLEKAIKLFPRDDSISG